MHRPRALRMAPWRPVVASAQSAPYGPVAARTLPGEWSCPSRFCGLAGPPGGALKCVVGRSASWRPKRRLSRVCGMAAGAFQILWAGGALLARAILRRVSELPLARRVSGRLAGCPGCRLHESWGVRRSGTECTAYHCGCRVRSVPCRTACIGPCVLRGGSGQCRTVCIDACISRVGTLCVALAEA